jgi:hypothetical protein
VDDTILTMTPLNSSVDTEYIGSQTRLSSGDIQSLNKAYSCEGRIATFGGGNDQVKVTHCFIKLANSIDTLILKKIKISSYIRKFRVEQLLSRL